MKKNNGFERCYEYQCEGYDLMDGYVLPAVYCGIVSLIVSAALLMTRKYHGHLTLDWLSGVQKVHSDPTPRVGGLSLMVGGITGLFVLPSEAAMLWAIILVSATPAFLAGLGEDLTNRVTPGLRLVITLVAGLLFTILSGYTLSDLGIPGLDWLLSFPLFALCFTAFAIGGITNAINIIDGFNGLASGTTLIVLVAFAVIAQSVGDRDLAILIVLSGALVVSFMVLNFPSGLLFLGDSGAYFLGIILAIFAVALPARNPDVAPLAGLIALGYPVTETLISMIRRKARKGGKISQADGGHLHSLMYYMIAGSKVISDSKTRFANPLTALLLWPFAVLCSVLAVVGSSAQNFNITSILLILWLYLWLYRNAARRNNSRDVLTARTKIKARVRQAEVLQGS